MPSIEPPSSSRSGASRWWKPGGMPGSGASRREEVEDLHASIIARAPCRRRREPADDDDQHRPLGRRDLLVAVRELPEHPAGQDLLDARRRRSSSRAAASTSARKLAAPPGRARRSARSRGRPRRSRRPAPGSCWLRATSRTSTRTRSGRAATSGAGSPRPGAAARAPARPTPRRARTPRAARSSSRGRSSRAAPPSTRSSGRGARARRPPPRRCRRRATSGSPCAAKTRTAASRISAALLLRWRLNGQSTQPTVVRGSAAVQPLAGHARRRPDALPAGPVREPRAAAARRARRPRRAARAATRCAPTAPEWDDALNAGKESVVFDLKADAGVRARAARARADVVLEGFRPGRRGAARRRPTRPRPPSTARSPASATGTARAAQAGHDLNYLG